MLKRFIAPIVTLAVVITGITIIGFNYDLVTQTNESNQDYFLKFIPKSNLVVVEPNYGRFYNPNPEIEGDSSGQILYSSLEDLQQNYDIKKAKMIRFQRKGKMIPNLYVHLESTST